MFEHYFRQGHQFYKVRYNPESQTWTLGLQGQDYPQGGQFQSLDDAKAWTGAGILNAR